MRTAKNDRREWLACNDILGRLSDPNYKLPER
jgi:hypothetical protein